MAAQDVMASAKQGSTQAIATLINKTLQPKGMLASVSKKNAQLNIKIQSQEKPEQDWVMKFLKGGLQKLQPTGISDVQVEASNGSSETLWKDSFELAVTNTVKQAQPKSQTPKRATMPTNANSTTAATSSLFGNQNIERGVIAGATFLLTSGLWLVLILAFYGIQQFRSANAPPAVESEETTLASGETPLPDEDEGRTIEEEVAVAEEPGKAFLVKHLEEVTTTSLGGTFDWCVESELLASSLYSPRSYEILQFRSTEEAVMATARIESSNKGGMPIVQNWNFFLQRGPTIFERNLRQDGKAETADEVNSSNQNWCIRSMDE